MVGKVLALTLLVVSFQSNARGLASSQEDFVKELVILAARGQFPQLLEKVKRIEPKLGKSRKSFKGHVQYWKGIAQNRVGDFFSSTKSFELAMKHGHKAKDLFYEYGQALYATDKLKKAKRYFAKSAKLKYKRPVSLYYMGFISQTQEQYARAVKTYKMISKLPPEEAKESEQAAQMQIGEIYLKLAEKRAASAPAKVESSVIPQFEHALKLDTSSPLAKVIDDRIYEVKGKYELILTKLRNGRSARRKRYFLKLGQEFKYDNNVIFEPDSKPNKATDRESAVSKTDLVGRNIFYVRDYMSLEPEGKIDYTRYFDSGADIRKNNQYNISLANKGKYEYSIKEKPATFLFDYTFLRNYKNNDQMGAPEFNSDKHTFQFGNRFSLFDLGETSIKYKYRITNSYDDSSDATSHNITFEQPMAFKNGLVLVAIASYETNDVQDEQNSTDVYTFITSWITPRVYNWFTPTVTLGMIFTDTKLQSASRGTERLDLVSIKLTKVLTKRYRLNGLIDYLSNNSKDSSTYGFRKTSIGMNVEVVF